MAAIYTETDLANLKKAYASGVLQVRDGNDYVEYQSMHAMRIAIQDMEAELSKNSDRGKPSGTRLVRVNRGY